VTLPRVDSTNNFLKKELAKSAPLPEGTVIMAEEQYAGRGQGSNSWISEPGKNLTFSILLQPGFLPLQNQFMLNKALSLAIYDALLPLTGCALKIKWPNDIYFNDDKLGGMLIENIIRGNEWKYAVAGIGINVNQVFFTGPIQKVTSIVKILHTEYNLKRLLRELCKTVQSRYLQLKAGEYKVLDSEYLQCLYRLNEKHLYYINGQTVDGTIKNIDENGRLQVLLEEGLRSFGLKEIAYVIP